jgi:pyruvyltransferase
MRGLSTNSITSLDSGLDLNMHAQPTAPSRVREAQGTPQRIYAFWCRIPSQGNLGDALTPWLIRKITNKYPSFARPNEPVMKYFVSGSIAGYTQEHCIVWGSGVISRTDRISPRATLLAVRGPITRQIALACGAYCPEVYGDPALLLPRFYRPPNVVRRGVGLVPHFSDKPRVANRPLASDYIRFIDIQLSVESFVNQVSTCEFVASSSLHGIIVSHAYGIPAAWIKYRDLPSGDDSKFHDYFRSVGLGAVEPIRVGSSGLDLEKVTGGALLPASLPDLDRLWECCPFSPSHL